MRLVWTTDPHLNHAPIEAWQRWVTAIASHGADGIVITGDISEGDDVVFQLERLVRTVDLPIYFVLGNHDFYRSSIGATRQDVIRSSRENRSLHYLTDMSAIELAEDCFLVGEDGWGDATEGDYEGSPVRLNDFPLIEDFQRADPAQWKQQLQDLGAASAERLRVKFDAVPSSAKQILVVTHVPPYRDACWYEGKTTDDDWAPFFVCGQLGSELRRVSEARRHAQLTVLCGHTHHKGIAVIPPNLIVHTGAADYGRPEVEGIVTFDGNAIRVGKPTLS